VLGYSHLALAELFEHHLLNGNVANNWLGCQSCNGTGVDTVPGGRPFNIGKQLILWDLDGVYK
jgi:deoxyribodipyrimidine photolyase